MIINLNDTYSTTQLCVKVSINKKKINSSDGGLRTKGYFKFSYKIIDNQWFIVDKKSNLKKVENKVLNYYSFNNNELPLITIITVVYNGKRYLEGTIQSIINQTYPNIEYIIIDGSSTDGTVDIIKKYEDKINYWISEKDNGIYDAMNKGIKFANRNSYLMWINAGDTLENIDCFLKSYKSNIDAYFFSVLQKKSTNMLKKWNIKKVNYINEKNLVYTGIHHQGFIVRKGSIKYLYNLHVGELADLLFMSMFLNNNNYKVVFVPKCYISLYTLGGLSDQGGLKRIISYFKLVGILKLNYFKFLVFNLNKIIKIYLKSLVSKEILATFRRLIK